MPLKILQATEYFLPDYEKGIERFVYELSRGLMGAGQDVTVLAGGRRRSRTLGGVRIEYASMYGNHMSRWTGNLYDQRITFVPSGILKMYRQDPDIVHAHHFGSGYAASLLKKYDDTPYVLTVHSAPSASPLASPIHVYRLMYKKALAGATSVVSVSNFVRDKLKQDLGIDSTVIPLSVDAQKFGTAVDKAAIRQSLGLPDTPIICMVSGIEGRRNRADLLVSAMPSILKKVRDAKLVLAGKARPECVAYLSDLAERIGVKDHLTITGKLDDLAVRDYLAASDVFVLPSKEEAGGTLVLESMASGTPIVCSGGGGISEYISDEVNGLLFDTERAGDLADKVVSLLADEKKAKAMGDNGRKLAVSGHAWGTAVSKYMSLYKDAVKA